MGVTWVDNSVCFCEGKRFFLAWLSLLFIVFSALPAWAGQDGAILVLQSYHPGMRWVANVEDGIRQQLAKHGGHVQLFIEYMDTKHLPFDAEYERFYAGLLQRKYGRCFYLPGMWP